MARIAITDGMEEKAILLFEKAGHEVIDKTYTPEELLQGALDGVDAIVVRSATKLTKEVIEASSSSLKVIARAGVGVDNIDLEAAGAMGVFVVNAPQASTQSVVELTLSHLLASLRFLPKANEGLKQGKWEKNALKGTELSGKALGLIGFGRIAQGVSRVAQAFGMEVHAFDPYVPERVAKSENTRLHKSVDSLFSACTHISIHCNLTDETHHLVNLERIRLMPTIGSDGIPCGNHIVNCARGGIVDEDEAFAALQSSELTSLALDVFEIEPVPADHALLQHPNFHGTPHIGASTLEAQLRVGLNIVDSVLDILDGKDCDFVVNRSFLQ
ncbi:MAG: hydroxyacid dehydrogenase [Candidatus Poseidoniales archaeon]